MEKIFLTQNKLLAEVRGFLLANLPSGLGNQDEIVIVINEVIQNIYRHAYQMQDAKPIMIKMGIDHTQVTFKINDQAPHVDLSFLHQKYEPSEEGQIGLNVIKKICSHYDVRHTDEGHETSCIIKLQQ
jgi:anti-sigma regulatory factor (Ser/Thr protein kinase)